MSGAAVLALLCFLFFNNIRRSPAGFSLSPRFRRCPPGDIYACLQTRLLPPVFHIHFHFFELQIWVFMPRHSAPGRSPKYATIFYMSLLCMLSLETHNFLKRFPFSPTRWVLLNCTTSPVPLIIHQRPR